jgi:hypothetical protein
MLETLLKNHENYLWKTNKDGDIILGTTNIEPKAQVKFTLTKKWANVAPIVENSPGNYIGKPVNYLSSSEEYKIIKKLIKLVKEYVKDYKNADHKIQFDNTMKLLQEFYT